MSDSLKRDLLRIAFIHPDLGIGGGERLILDAALHLQKSGHKVTIFAAHCDRNSCFDEMRDDALDIRIFGDFLPTHIGQRLRAPCGIARVLYLVCSMALRGGRFDMVFCDLVAHAIPLLRLLSRAKILFYCHYPDRLLTPPRERLLYRLYRAPIDKMEEIGVRMADRALVNSLFTASEFRRAFPRVGAIPLEVLYPGVDPAPYDHQPAERPGVEDRRVQNNHSDIMILSINRFEQKKNIGLAIEALACLRERVPEKIFERVELMVAGGYDNRLRESREVLRELQVAAQKFRLESHVAFRPSCSETERVAFLSRCLCVVYTPENEHFGLVPLEAMAAGRPIIAVKSGGPLETVVDGETGLLCDPTPQAFADAILRFLSDPGEAGRMGRAGRAHVAERFSLAAFGSRLESIVRDLVAEGKSGRGVPETV